MMLMKDVLERSLRLHASLLGFSQAMAGLPRKQRSLAGSSVEELVQPQYGTDTYSNCGVLN